MSLKLAESLHTSTHDRTKISRENRAIERRLEGQLNALVELVRGQVSDTTSEQTITSIQRRLDREVAEILKANIQASYLLGIAYVSKLLRREAFMTINDIMACETLVNDYKNRFWGRVTKTLQGVHDSQMNLVVSNPNTLVTSLATDATVKALNLGTAMKTKELVGTQQLMLMGRITRILNPAPFALGGIKDIEERALSPNNIPQPVLVLVWVITQDDRTCPQCLDLEGTEYDINDFNIPTPGHESTHWNCRCRLMLAETEP